jgi:hypothetical protein
MMRIVVIRGEHCGSNAVDLRGGSEGDDAMEQTQLPQEQCQQENQNQTISAYIIQNNLRPNVQTNANQVHQVSPAAERRGGIIDAVFSSGGFQEAQRFIRNDINKRPPLTTRPSSQRITQHLQPPTPPPSTLLTICLQRGSR